MDCNFITNLPATEISGGWSGISFRIYEQLGRFSSAHFIGPINPPYPLVAKAYSKIRRKFGLRGNFTLFSEDRLNKISRLYNHYRRASSNFDFFHGATPWLKCNPPCDYGAYIDATFPMYLEIYSQPDIFLPSDVERITVAEREWLGRAGAVFFGSDWARQRAISDYQLDPAKCHVTWVGGNVTVPDGDQFSGGRKFLFISLAFAAKGGFHCVEAFKVVRQRYPDAELIIIGEKPPKYVLEQPGVKYVGFFRKTVESELKQFCDYLSQARGLVHPTSMDTMGMVLIEAGYYSCPSIATRRFGIPELVKDKETGYLLDLPVSSSQIAEYMLRLCEDKSDYQAMRKAVREYTTRNLTWDAFGDRISEVIKSFQQ